MKQIIFRVHGMNVSPKFGIPVVKRDDAKIAERRDAEHMERGTLVHEVAPCRTDDIAGEVNLANMYVCDIHVQMIGEKGTTPVTTVSYIDEGREPFRLTLKGTPEEIEKTLMKYRAWLQGFMLRSWESGQLYHNPNGLISVNVVGPLKLDGDHEPLYTSDLLVGDQPAANASEPTAWAEFDAADTV